MAKKKTPTEKYIDRAAAKAAKLATENAPAKVIVADCHVEGPKIEADLVEAVGAIAKAVKANAKALEAAAQALQPCYGGTYSGICISSKD